MRQPLKRLFIVDQSLLQPGGHYFEYSTGIGVGALSCGLEPVILCNRALGPNPHAGLPGGITLLPTFTHRWHEGAYEGEGRYGPGHLGQELFAVLDRYDAGPNDRVLVHTLGWHQAAQLFDRLLATPRSLQDALPPLAILLRYDPAELDLNMRAVFRDRLQRISADRILSHKLSLYSDTDRLTDSLSQLFDFPVATLPIPFNQQVLLDALTAMPTRVRRGPLTITYVGDARDEKGYPLLPAALAELWHDYVLPGRIRFVLQSNFNMPGGETLAGPARAKLERYSPPEVTLVRDALNTTEYYNLIAAADILVIPYDPIRYELRSSGILVEALTAGKVVVTSKGSWMETKVDESHAVLFGADGLVPALVEAIESYDRLAAGAKDVAIRWRTESSPRHFVEYLEQSMSPSLPVVIKTPSVLLIIDAECMVLRNGASRVALNQLSFLFRAGYKVTGLFVSTAADTPQALFALRRAVERELAALPFFDLHVAGYAPQADGELSDQIYKLARFAGEHSIDCDLAGRRGIAVPDLLRKRLGANKPDIVLLNYVFNLPILDTLPLEGVPILCEMHDIQSHQRAIYGQRQIDHADLALETALLGQCDHIIALNEREAEWVKERLPQKPMSYIPIVASNRPAAADALRDADALTQLVARCGCPRLDRRTPAYDAVLVEKLNNFNEVDLLVVSSGHISNVSGLGWFFEKVYFPYLVEVGITIVVAGTIADAGNWPDHPNIVFTGLVEHLAPLYAATKVVVLPIVEGAGSPVKTIEALASAKPVVATTVALRGLGDEAKRIAAADTPDLFAAQILALLRDPTARLAAARHSFEVSQQTMSVAEYDRRFGAAIHQLIGHRSLIPQPSPLTSPPSELVEWREMLGVVNRAVRALCSDWAIDVDGLARLRVLLQQPHSNEFHELVERRLGDLALSAGSPPVSLSAVEAVLAAAEHCSAWHYPDGRIQPIGFGPLRFLAGSKLCYKLLLRSGVSYQIEVVTCSGFDRQFTILLNGTALACDEVRIEGSWAVHLFRVALNRAEYLPVLCDFTVQAAREFTLDDFRISRRLSFTDDLTLIDSVRLHTIDSSDSGQPLSKKNCLMCGPAGQTLTLPLLGMRELTLGLIVSEAWGGATARFCTRLGDLSLTRVREYSLPSSTLIEFAARESAGGSELQISLPTDTDWPSGSLGISSVYLSESLLPVLSERAGERLESFRSGQLSVESFIDRITADGDVLGWARCREIPRLRLSILAMTDGRVIASTIANAFRQDLLDAGKGDGYCFFILPLGRATTETCRGHIQLFAADGLQLVSQVTVSESTP